MKSLKLKAVIGGAILIGVMATISGLYLTRSWIFSPFYLTPAEKQIQADINALEDQARELFSRQEFVRGEQVLKQAFALADDQLAPDHLVTGKLCISAHFLINLNDAEICKDPGLKKEYQEKKLEYFRKGIGIYEHYYGSKNAFMADLYQALADDYFSCSDFKSAVLFYNKSLIANEHCDYIHLTDLQYDNRKLGECYRQLGDNPKANKAAALSEMVEADSLCSDSKPSKHFTLGRYFRERDDHQASLGSFARAVKLIKKRSYPGSSDLAACYYQMGRSYELMTDRKRALKFYRKAEKMLTRRDAGPPENQSGHLNKIKEGIVRVSA